MGWIRSKNWLKQLVFTSVAAVVVVALGIAYGGARADAAGSIHITGTVTRQNGTPVQNVAVSANQPGSSTVLHGPATTDANGAYQLDVDAGTYDFHFMPPAGSVLDEVVHGNVTVFSDQTIDIQLAASPRTLSGTITDAQGNPVTNNIYVQLGGNVGYPDAQGHYNVSLPAGEYSVILKMNFNGGFYSQTTLTPADPQVNLTANVTRDFQLPETVTLSIATKDHTGAPVTDQPVEFRTSGSSISTSDTFSVTNYGHTQTNNSGVGSAPVFKGTVAPAQQVCTTFQEGNVRVCNTADVAMDANAMVELQGLATYTFSGVITDDEGAPVANMGVQLGGNAGITNTNGEYTVSMLEGVYSDLQLRFYNFPVNARFYPVDSTVDLSSANIVRNFQLPPSVHLSVLAKDSTGAPVADVPVQFRSSADGLVGGTDTYNNVTVVSSRRTDNSGVAVLPIYKDSNVSELCVNSFPATGSMVCAPESFVVSADMSTELQELASYVMSGTVTKSDGSPAENVAVYPGVDYTDSSGQYSFNSLPGTYESRLNYRNLQTRVGYTLRSTTPLVVASANIERNFVLPAEGSLTVVVKDEAGNPLSGEQVDFSVSTNVTTISDEYSMTLNGGYNTSESGSDSKQVFMSSGYQVCVIFVTSTNERVCRENVTVGQQTTIIFQQSSEPETLPAPDGLAAQSPTNQAPDLTWNAVSGADHYDVFRDGQNVGSVTGPAFTDSNVSDGSHEYYVVAVNDSDNASEPSNTVAVVVDTTVPTITYTLSPAANAAGWHNTNVTVTFACADGGTGVAACSGVQTITTEGTNLTVTGTVTDNAGNTASVTTTALKIDKTLPTVNAFTIQSKTVNQTRNLVVTAGDQLSGLVAGEYFIGNDPGVGNGTVMTRNGNQLSTTLGTNLPAGVYQVTVRSRDAAGNWSTNRSAQFVVTATDADSLTGNRSYTPSAASGDVLPGIANAGVFDNAQYNVNVGYNANGFTANQFTFNYTSGGLFCRIFPTGQNCHSLTVTVTSSTLLMINGTNRSHAVYQGVATVVADGVTTTNTVTFEVTDGNKANATAQDQFALKVYASGSGPTGTPLYQTARTIPRGNGVVIQ